MASRKAYIGFMMKKVLFVCVENAGRSQIAEAFARHHGKGIVEAQSAGTMPGIQVNPTVFAVMKEKGIDLSKNRPKMLDPNMIEQADAVITMGCSVAEYCPAPMLKKTVDWGLEDPRGRPIEDVRRIRDEIERRVLQFLRNG